MITLSCLVHHFIKIVNKVIAAFWDVWSLNSYFGVLTKYFNMATTNINYSQWFMKGACIQRVLHDNSNIRYIHIYKMWSFYKPEMSTKRVIIVFKRKVRQCYWVRLEALIYTFKILYYVYKSIVYFKSYGSQRIIFKIVFLQPSLLHFGSKLMISYEHNNMLM